MDRKDFLEGVEFEGGFSDMGKLARFVLVWYCCARARVCMCVCVCV